MRIIEGHPVHLPGAEQELAGMRHHFVTQRTISRRLFQNYFTDVGGVYGNPSVLAQEYLDAAMLAVSGVLGGDAEALVAQVRLGNPQTVNVPRRQPNRAGQADIECVQVSALAA